MKIGTQIKMCVYNIMIIGILILVVVAIVILALRKKMAASGKVGRGLLAVGDTINAVRFFGFVIIISIVLLLGHAISGPKKKTSDDKKKKSKS